MTQLTVPRVLRYGQELKTYQGFALLFLALETFAFGTPEVYD